MTKRERQRQYRLRYTALHPDRVRASVLRNRARCWALMAELKDFPCADCGDHFPPECMDFDHVRGEKKFNVGEMKNLRREKILEEIKKCDLVCANCHRTRTRNRRLQGTD